MDVIFKINFNSVTDRISPFSSLFWVSRFPLHGLESRILQNGELVLLCILLAVCLYNFKSTLINHDSKIIVIAYQVIPTIWTLDLLNSNQVYREH